VAIGMISIPDNFMNLIGFWVFSPIPSAIFINKIKKLFGFWFLVLAAFRRGAESPSSLLDISEVSGR
jgi:hypothetical protein